MQTALDQILNDCCQSIQSEIGKGAVASYIPPLACVDPTRFGAAIATVDGQRAIYGDAQEPFSVQSISKVFTLALALEQHDHRIWARVGREPSGSRFNSIVQLEHESGIPRNPLINAGALVISDLLLEGRTPAEAVTQIRHFMQTLSGDDSVCIDPEVAAAEQATGFRNMSLANFLRSFNNLQHAVDDVLAVYFQQCALSMTCEQLARAALFLANGGVNPATGVRVVSEERARRINSIMMLCGHYDGSGDFAFRVGLPGKSGVGGGIVVVVPDRAAICVWSPPLTASGNSLAGTAALEAIVRATGWGVL